MDIVKDSGNYFIHNNIQVLKKLEPGNYSLDWDAKGNCYLRDEQDFRLPKRIYGNEEFKDQVLKSFFNFNENMGILLEGQKGTGKTLDSKRICISSNLPVIIISKSIPIEVDFISFINSIDQDILLFIDEFEKLFQDQNTGKDFHNQNVFLSFMNGSRSRRHKILFLLTSNSEIGEYFRNRPSRVKYYKKYFFMSKEVYDSIIEDRLIDKESFKEDLVRNLPISEATVDLLNCIIDEINLHNKKYSSFKEFFNHKSVRIEYIKRRFDEQKNTYVFVDNVKLSRVLTMEDSGNYVPELGGYIDITFASNEEIFYNKKILKYSDDDDDESDSSEEVKTIKIEKYKLEKISNTVTVQG